MSTQTLQFRSEPHQQLTYSNNVKMVADQNKNPFRMGVVDVPASGEAMSTADLVGRLEANRGTNNDRRNPDNPPDLSRRWAVFPDVIDSGQLIDKEEKLTKAMDPTSTYVQSHTKAVEKGVGDVILGTRFVSRGNFELTDGGILGAAVDGKRPGMGKVALPPKCYTAAGGLGLTLDKLKESQERLRTDDFGLETDDELYCAIGPRQITNLLDIADGDGKSLNAFEQAQLRSGRPTNLMGINWVYTNRLPRDGNGDRMCPIWAKQNIIMAVWQDVMGAMWNDGSKRNLPQILVDAYVDVVRIEDEGVHVIACSEG